MGKSYWIWQRLVLHVTHCHTWCHHMGEVNSVVVRGHIYFNSPYSFAYYQAKGSFQQKRLVCIKKFRNGGEERLVLARWDEKLFPPSSKLKTRVNWKCSMWLHSRWTFFCNCRSSISQNSFNETGAFLKGSFLLLHRAKKSFDKKTFWVISLV